MKKMFLFITLLFITASAVYADSLGYFMLSISSGTAGQPMTLAITAYDTNNSVMTGYSGNVTLTASVGYVGISATSTNVTPNFSAGFWNGTVYLTGAGNLVTLTATDYSLGVTSTANVNVMPGTYSKLLLLTDGMVYAPGTVSGYTGSPANQTTTIPFNVTVIATDAYYNMITTNLPTVMLTVKTCAYSVTPVTIDLSSTGDMGYFGLTVTPSPDEAAYQQLYCNDFNNPTIFFSQQVWFNTLTQYYISASVPIAAIAGVPFPVTVTMSHSQGGPPINSFTWTATIYFQSTNPNMTVPISAPNNTLSITNGAGMTMVSYNKRDTVWGVPNLEIVPSYYCCNNSISITAVSPSNLMHIYSSSPVVCSFTADNYTLGKGNTANLTAFIEDAYLNPVSNTAVDFAIISGEGSISTRTATTDYYGNAGIVFTAPDANTRTVISAQPHGMPVTETVQLICSVSTPNSHKFINQPNPFAAGRETTAINYYLDYDSDVRFWVYNVYGGVLWKKEINKGSDGSLAGGNTVVWDGKTDNGFIAGSGLYILRMVVKNSRQNYTLERNIVIKK